MSEVHTAVILRHLDDSAQPADRELLARFVHHRDQSAFERLVRRHGPMVLAVCRRVVGHPQDAEDAFQAAFLVLAQKGASLSDPDLLGNWLYGVAVRVGQKARRTAARRRARERQVTAMPDPVAAVAEGPNDIGPVLHDELAKLPSCYRDAIVLCDLRGVSRADAAIALGVPEGTLSSRLANGRKKLADRLSRRGVALSAAAIPAVLAEARAATVPETLIAKTCGLAADVAAGTVVAGEVVQLANGGFDVRTMLVIGVLGAALTAVGVVFAARPDADPQTKKDPPKKSDPPAAKVDPAKPVTVAKYATTPALVNRYDINISVNSQSFVRWSDDGKRLLVTGFEFDPTVRNFGDSRPTRSAARVVAFEPLSDRALKVEEKEQYVGFAPVGDVVVSELREHNLLSGNHRLTLWERSAIEPKERASIYEPKRSVTLHPDFTIGYDFAASGETFRTVAVEKDAAGEVSRFEVREVSAGTGEVLKSFGKHEGERAALSPDGKRLAVLMAEQRFVIIDIDTKKHRGTQLPLPELKRRGNPEHIVFSADGRRVVIAGKYNETHVVNADTGDILPALEGLAQSEAQVQLHAFTSDGRLVALNGTRYIVRKIPAGVGADGVQRHQVSIDRSGQFVGVWDTQTGKALKVWDRTAMIAFSPTAPTLATLEKSGPETTRLGLWNFAGDE